MWYSNTLLHNYVEGYQYHDREILATVHVFIIKS